MLVLAIVVALVWANSPRTASYEDLWTSTFTIGFTDHHLSLTLREWVNDGLMAVFFFVVGLEIKRELVEGELRDPRKAALPVIAALGGMVVPALIYVAFNAGGDGARRLGHPDGHRHRDGASGVLAPPRAAGSLRHSSCSCSRSRSSTTSARSS